MESGRNNTEIELKAHAKDPSGCMNRLNEIAGNGTAFSKNDSYWFVPENKPAMLPDSRIKLPPSGLRVRQEKKFIFAGTSEETEYTCVTWKYKEKKDGLEINEEHEFKVSDGTIFEQMLLMFGLEKRIAKQKEGWVWQYEGITAELCDVSGIIKPGNAKNLGWFLELEILAKTGSDIAAAGERLLLLLEKAGINKENIESRYYSEMLSD